MLQPKHTKAYLPLAMKISDEFVDHIDKFKELDGSVIEFSDEVYKWALESIAAIAMNTRLDCLKKNIDSKALTKWCKKF